MDQRGGVDHFDHGGQRDVLFVGPADGLAVSSSRAGPEPFAPQAEGVLDQLIDERAVARQFPP